MKKQTAADVTVTPELRDWSVSKGWPMYLPDVFLTDFRDRCEANGHTYANAVKAFQNQIRWASPGQRFYSAQEWETKVKSARQMERQPARTSRPPDTVAGREVQQGVQAVRASDVARAALAAARGALK